VLHNSHGDVVEAVIIESLYHELSGACIRQKLPSFSGADLAFVDVTSVEVCGLLVRPPSINAVLQRCGISLEGL
jgi:hypothetical protein